jgi:hypothetical protein
MVALNKGLHGMRMPVGVQVSYPFGCLHRLERLVEGHSEPLPLRFYCSTVYRVSSVRVGRGWANIPITHSCRPNLTCNVPRSGRFVNHVA